MIAHRGDSWASFSIASFLCLGMGVFLIIHANPKRGITPENALLERSGKLGFRPGRILYYFCTASSTPLEFLYRNTAGETQAVGDSLSHAGDEVVKVGFDVHQTIWELNVGGRKIRTYADTSAAWEANNRTEPWFGLFFVAGGLFLGYQSRQGYKRKYGAS